MASLDSVLNFVIPAILIVIALGFIWTKFIEPWVLPHAKRFWEYLQGQNSKITRQKEVVYE